MSTRASAARYARALLDVAVKESDPVQAEQDLARFVDLATGHPELHNALTHPSLPAARKTALMQELLARLNLLPPVAKLLRLLAERDRLVLLPDLLAVYRERLMEHQQIIRAEVTTAAPLAADRVAALEQRLADVTGRKIAMTTKVDPSIIGGLVARVGSTVYDGSVAAQLEKMKHALVERS
jgi:F-type H+-transporting ATPase subunit delta